MGQVAEAVRATVDNVEKVIVGKRKQIELVAIAFLRRGHVLLDDVPGTGKTMLARTFATSPPFMGRPATALTK